MAKSASPRADGHTTAAFVRVLPPQAAADGPRTCLYCDEVIEMAESVVVVDHDRERETSLEREPELLSGPRRMLLTHTRCAPAGWRDE